MNEKIGEKMKKSGEKANKEVMEILKAYVPSTLPEPVWAKTLYAYLNDRCGLVSDYTIRKYARELAGTLSELDDDGLKSDPREIGRDEIKHLLGRWNNRDLHPNTIVWKMNHLNLLLKFYNNEILKKMRINLRPVERTNARWIKREIMDAIFDVAEELGPQYALRIHLGHDLLLRKSEMLKIKLSDIVVKSATDGEIRIIGKGKSGGKPAVIPFSPDTMRYLEPYLEWREKLITKAKKHGESIPKEDWLFIWYRPGIGIGREGKTTADNRLAPIISEVRKRMNLSRLWRFGYHDLRRTGARRYWDDGMDILAIQALLRHESLETTIRYLRLKKEIVRLELARLGPRENRRAPSGPMATFAERVYKIMSFALSIRS